MLNIGRQLARHDPRYALLSCERPCLQLLRTMEREREREREKHSFPERKERKFVATENSELCFRADNARIRIHKLLEIANVRTYDKEETRHPISARFARAVAKFRSRADERTNERYFERRCVNVALTLR